MAVRSLMLITSQQDETMEGKTQTITLEGQTYAVSELTSSAMSTVQSLLFAEMRIRELQTEITISQVAYVGFLNTLKVELAQLSKVEQR